MIFALCFAGINCTSVRTNSFPTLTIGAYLTLGVNLRCPFYAGFLDLVFAAIYVLFPVSPLDFLAF